MHAVERGQLRRRLLAPNGGQCHLGFELRTAIRSCLAGHDPSGNGRPTHSLQVARMPVRLTKPVVQELGSTTHLARRFYLSMLHLSLRTAIPNHLALVPFPHSSRLACL